MSGAAMERRGPTRGVGEPVGRGRAVGAAGMVAAGVAGALALSAASAGSGRTTRRNTRHTRRNDVLLAAAIGAATARAAYRRLEARPPGGAARWQRSNNRGRTVTLLEGPAVALGIAAGAAAAPGIGPAVRLAGAGAVLGAGAVGLYDDLRGSAAAKGLRGHLRALAHGEVTTGVAKIVGIGASGLAAGCVLRRGPVDRLLAAVVVAGSANVVNLFDLRPGRAVKAAALGGAVGVARGSVLGAAALGAAAALLPEDLGERAMLGDAGANALGAALGVAAVARASRGGLVGAASLVIGLTAASEKVSFTKVIEATPALRFLDGLGRRSA